MATAPDGAPVDGFSALARIRALLRDRFGLRTHTEMRELSVYELRSRERTRALAPGSAHRPLTVLPPNKRCRRHGLAVNCPRV